MLKHKYDLVLLDLDGTVADTDELIVQTMYQLYDLYRNGRKTPLEEIYYFSGPPIAETLKKEFPDMDNQFMIDEFVRISWDYYATVVNLFPHVKETLISLRNQGIKLGIVTSKSKGNCTHCLKCLEIDTLVDYVVTRDDVIKAKPDPEGLLLAIKHFSILNKEKVLYIGDNKSDYDSARNAGIDVGLVTWGPRKIDTSLSPEYWLNDFKELEEIINE